MKPNHQLADAIREVTASIQIAIEEGQRSRRIDADDLVEVLLAIADRLDPHEPRWHASQMASGEWVVSSHEPGQVGEVGFANEHEARERAREMNAETSLA